MNVTDSLINNLANLSRLEFDAAESAALKEDLQRMIAFVEKLNEVDTMGIEPLLHMSGQVNILRDDAVQPALDRKAALDNAPFKDEIYFKVPKVIQK